MASNSCFTRQQRLLHSREFQQVFNNTQCKSADPLLTLLATENDIGCARLGLALSKKRIKRAVSRNRLKRLIRESFRRHQHELPNIDVVIIGQTRVEQVSNQEVFDSLEVHWKKITARCKKSSLS